MEGEGRGGLAVHSWHRLSACFQKLVQPWPALVAVWRLEAHRLRTSRSIAGHPKYPSFHSGSLKWLFAVDRVEVELGTAG